MNTEINCYENEFIGEIARYCLDEDYIWFYDEISGGLYRLNKKDYIVEVILTPIEIHQQELFPILQILKWKNEVYLIPNNICHEWLVYNIVNHQLRKVYLSSQSYEVGNAVNIGEWIYLIPTKTNHILAIVEAGTLNIKIINTNWYKNNIRKFECWGHSVFGDTILFPIIDKGEIFQIQGEQIIELPLHIEQAIYSVSLSKNGIWILPNKGNNIFLIDRNGKFRDSVEIQTNWYENAAERYARIVAMGSYIYLFPKQGGQILILEVSKKEWTAIGKKDEPLYRSLYQKARNFPYWGCYYNDGKLYTLPIQYRLAEINIEDKSINYKILQYATTHMGQQYMTWIRWLNEKAQTNIHVEWERNSLKNFMRITSENNTTYNTRFIGKDIWGMVDKF